MNASDSLREWTVAVQATCITCGHTDSASVISTSCEDARKNAVKVLRYKGWRLMAEGHRYDDLCPEHADPPPLCELCGDPTPREYANKHSNHITGVNYCCPACWRKKFDERMVQRRPS